MNEFLVDAFTERLGGGNPAGVFLLEGDFPEAEWMGSKAAQLGYSETCFVKPLDEGTYNLRYFTPSEEVPLCGHATVAAFSVLRHMGRDVRGEQFLTQSGWRSVGLEGELVWLELAPPALVDTLDWAQAEPLYQAYGLSREDAHPILDPEIISVGLKDIMLPVASRESLLRAVQDEGQVIALSRQYGVTGVHMYCLGQGDVLAHCRNFAPRYAIPEESATGTANGGLTFGLIEKGLALPEQVYTLSQGESMGRPSQVFTKLEVGTLMSRIWVGGQAVIYPHDQ